MLQEKTKIFKALSDPNRLRILKMLQGKTLCVCEITAVLKLATSTVSNHLSVLKDSGFILEEKDGKWVNYKVNPRPGDSAVANILSMLPFWLEGDEVLKNDLNTCSTVDRNKLCCK
ncbi:MAG: metalloregulator ArsR/SmtB family transcription factor [Ignavibacteriales bacterium]|nr:metalloregulator ArsR/SmtB family transcription factor [Ignavibacteriales bacterium]